MRVIRFIFHAIVQTPTYSSIHSLNLPVSSEILETDPTKKTKTATMTTTMAVTTTSTIMVSGHTKRTMVRAITTARKACLLVLLGLSVASAFVKTTPIRSSSPSHLLRQHQPHHPRHFSTTSRLEAFKGDNDDDKKSMEDARINILRDRRKSIRSCLKSAEAVRNLRILQGWVPELDEDGKAIQSDGKSAVTLTAFGVAAGAILLRVGGRAALVSAVGLDFVTDNPELKANLDQILEFTDTMDPATKAALFTAAWTVVKVLCVDAGGVALALSSGILFGGVLQGAVASAAAATIGSSVAFSLAKLDTPVRVKALELLEEYPSLRGIEKVVARDGIKAILTLRLAPILPIPLGLYNYVYGVTNVAYLDFAGGIFLGSLKPYLLDSYLGYFGKEIVDGTSDASGMQDIILLGVLGVSVLVGVFASQLAGETWDTVLQEVEEEKKLKAGKEGEDDEDDGLTRTFVGWELPEFLLDFQRGWRQADVRVSDMIIMEYKAKVWNSTATSQGLPADRDPARMPMSPEKIGVNQGIDIGASIFDGLILSPQLFSAFSKYANPLYNEDEDESLKHQPQERRVVVTTTTTETDDPTKQEMLARLAKLRVKAERRLESLEGRLRDEIE
jgi:uncharacterized membrane protein YdjX (TVP38/TMEM64 family)